MLDGGGGQLPLAAPPLLLPAAPARVLLLVGVVAVGPWRCTTTTSARCRRLI